MGTFAFVREDSKGTYDTSDNRGQTVDFCDAVFVVAINFQGFQVQCHPSLEVGTTGQLHQPRLLVHMSPYRVQRGPLTTKQCRKHRIAMNERFS